MDVFAFHILANILFIIATERFHVFMQIVPQTLPLSPMCTISFRILDGMDFRMFCCVLFGLSFFIVAHLRRTYFALCVPGPIYSFSHRLSILIYILNV